MQKLAGLALAAAIAAFTPSAHAADAPIAVMAAENFYADIASAVGGGHVAVKAVLSNPDQDPHLFETSPSVARDVSAARLVIYNGADYDPWMEKLLAAAKSDNRATLVVADLMNRKTGDNPHLWYDPATAPAVAKAIATQLSAIDPANAADYAAGLAAFEATLDPLADKVAAIRKKFAGQPVTATEPVFGYMAEALGLTMRNESFQLSVMNDTEPSAQDTAAFQADLKDGKVKVLFYNSQVTDPQTDRLLEIAKAGGVPVVGVTETMPAGKSFADWMLGELDATEKALGGPSS
ncbi:MAG: zinc ABC transporter substrate-binding protein [Rhizobiales bacterium]|nr:zinc ABC transporter substrate-binding protein [Hyphomicrobiales bacterium]MBN9010587.1 zinc ABC transporter substrate-binding protein [Hyphomicrobiales bacterium]